MAREKELRVHFLATYIEALHFVSGIWDGFEQALVRLGDGTVTVQIGIVRAMQNGVSSVYDSRWWRHRAGRRLRNFCRTGAMGLTLSGEVAHPMRPNRARAKTISLPVFMRHATLRSNESVASRTTVVIAMHCRLE